MNHALGLHAFQTVENFFVVAIINNNNNVRLHEDDDDDDYDENSKGVALHLWLMS